MQPLRYFRGSLRTMTWLDRAVVLSVALLLALQLMLSGQHKDDLAGYGDNCPSCVFAHHLPSGLPDVDPVALPPRQVLSYRLEPAAVYRSRSFVSFLIPESQAPPRA
ncbi:hypothetical protein [Massilia sp. 9096]|uniref:hypothetical protein n=1 Tax=Massilia sp. 9096 TaxID=1500894 RepID=UPI00056C0C04|nr:hypothetical protein [Massilia sp. 9096]